MSLGELRSQTGLIGLFHFENNATDSSGAGNNGTGTAITYSQANGKFNLGAGFNGGSSKIALPAGLVAFTTSMTIFGRINVTSTASQGFILSSDSGNGYTLYITNEGVLKLGVKTSAYGELAGPTITTGIWYDVGATYDGSNFTLYINGDYWYSLPKTGNIVYGETNNAWLGSYGGSSNWYNGKMDEFCFFNTVKPASWFRKQYSIRKFGEI